MCDLENNSFDNVTNKSKLMLSRVMSFGTPGGEMVDFMKNRKQADGNAVKEIVIRKCK